MILIRRIHLYAGLFLLPWVFLYGITGAMFNHLWLLPEAEFRRVDATLLSETPMHEFPAPEELAQQVVESIRMASPESEIFLGEDVRAEFTNPLNFETQFQGQRHVVQINPVHPDVQIVVHPPKAEQLEPLLKNINTIQLEPNPHALAQAAAKTILAKNGVKVDGLPQPLGWTKLNFVATVNGEAARVTYVLKDGHIDVTKFTGEDGMSARQFFLRLHTSHGQSPHFNGRWLWSFILDTMAIAMVCWGLSGILMWWQIKRTRIIGIAVLALSVVTASALYFSMMNFYATTKL